MPVLPLVPFVMNNNFLFCLFQVQIGNIGEIYKIRIGHDDNTEYAGWMCDKVREDIRSLP